MTAEIAYIGLGSNLSQPQQQLCNALQALATLPDTQLTGQSALYRSAPLGPTDQPSYINAVARLSTYLSPLALLDALQAIEQQQGRIRQGERWGPRTLDLDIVLFGSQLICEPRLQVPHYHLQARAFVLYPLAELVAEDFRLPDGRWLRQLLAECPPEGIERLTQASIIDL
ncbi:2-amino-4-hydroxy-6-hydroxymethyldihydropteridine diphosphokinase [Azomonas agilis]|uniref:2-amino-4-hydroxy-6-hydroxymethyldihydropteridine pyrophosphokinase n=1 Tax=Azomonas agilis TaxID=116849 RepID=A0A562J2M0_9GAMM|nr:2-amino-4-hydroxy-6-hydroxymethyldihydropteridine diphosphokinase [Azomonas agilis]TWH77373.1 2-amino-4-hydroxy-6-hydroxymethyldihydropteridine diphosphokinase [Azomonas agilis]